MQAARVFYWQDKIASMYGNSSPVISNQDGIHQQLEATVRKHLGSTFQRPIARHAYDAWSLLKEKWGGSKGLVLDSGCGTAQSTRMLAEKHADCFVVGVDRSVVRLDKQADMPANSLLLRTNLEDLWRLMAADNVRLAHHYLLYPNPYPKAAQLRYRWHGSPAFPSLIALGGELTLRSNWRLYLEEFGQALKFAEPSAKIALDELSVGAKSLTVFEKKYCDSNQRLYQLAAKIP